MVRVLAISLLLLCVLSCRQSQHKAFGNQSAKLAKALELANNKVDCGNPEAALALVETTFGSIQPSAADSLNRFTFLYNLNYRQEHYLEAVRYADSVLKRIQGKTEDSVWRRFYANALFTKGDALYALGTFSAGLRAYYKAQQLGMKHGDKCVLGDFAYRLGNINFRQEKYGEAAANFYKALLSAAHCEKESFTSAAYRQLLLNNIGLCLTRQGQADSGLVFFGQAAATLEINARRYQSRKNFWIVSAQVLRGNLAEAFIQKKNYEIAETLLKNALSVTAYQQLEAEDAMLSRIKLAQVYLLSGQQQQAESTLQDAKESRLLEGNLKAAYLWYELWGNLQEEKGNYQEAATALQSALSRRDKYLEDRRKYLLLNLDENIQLLNQAELNASLLAQVDRNNLLIIIILLALLLFILAGCFLFYNYRKSNKYVQLLRVLNERIQSQKNELENTLNALNQSHEEKDRIMHMVAHDLRSPVASIYWLANAMLEDADLTPEYKENLELILLASTNSLSLTKDMLEAVSLLQTKEINRSPVDLNRLLQQQAQLLHTKLEEKKLSLNINQPGTPVTAAVDAEKFNQVISNLVTNAIKFSHDGGAISISLAEQGQDVVLTVCDSGVGIPEKNLEKIFDAFSEARRAGTKGEKSYGLGLSISRRIVGLHDGYITAGNHPDGGAVFTVVIPKTPVLDIR